MVAVLVTLALALSQPPAVEVSVASRATQARSGVMRGSVAFAPGAVPDVATATTGGASVPCVPLVRWADGSVAVAQVHARVSLAVGERRRLRLAPDAPAPEAVPAARPGEDLFDTLALRTEVEDPWGRIYVARPRVSRERIVPSSALVSVRRVEGLHESADGAFLALSGYLVTFAGERRAELTLVLDNARLPGQPVLGPVRLRAFRVVTESAELRLRPRFIAENALAPPVAREADGGWCQPLLGPSQQIYLGDGTGKAFRFDLFHDDAAATDAERRDARASARAPLRGFADVDEVRRSGAFGAHGGPAPRGADHSWQQLLAWRRGAGFGAFGGHGDPRDAATQGTPRNGPSALHNVLRWASDDLLDAAESMVLQHCLRPAPGRAPRLPAATRAFREGLSPRTVERPHGFTPLDYEHFSVDLLYDYYWLTGDPLAREELARMGRGLPHLLDGVPFMTARGEGWCLQAGVSIARATGDRALIGLLSERFHERILPVLGRPPQSFALAQPPHPDAFGDGVTFDAPWQMAALVHGLSALYAETGDEVVAAAVRDVAETMATAGWIEGEGPKYLVSARDAGVFRRPIGFGVGEGTAWLQIGAFELAARHADAGDPHRALWRRRADFLARPRMASRWAGGHPWFQLYLDARSAR